MIYSIKNIKNNMEIYLNSLFKSLNYHKVQDIFKHIHLTHLQYLSSISDSLSHTPLMQWEYITLSLSPSIKIQTIWKSLSTFSILRLFLLPMPLAVVVVACTTCCCNMYTILCWFLFTIWVYLTHLIFFAAPNSHHTHIPFRGEARPIVL